MASFFEKLSGSRRASSMDVSTENEEHDENTEYEIETVASRGSALSRRREQQKVAAEPEGQLTVDIFENGDQIIIQSAVAGTDPKDIDITLSHDMITIKGIRKRNAEISDENYYYRELYWGSFSRSIILPEEVDEDKSEASIKNGVLTIKLLKKNRPKTQKIQVASSD